MKQINIPWDWHETVTISSLQSYVRRLLWFLCFWLVNCTHQHYALPPLLNGIAHNEWNILRWTLSWTMFIQHMPIRYVLLQCQTLTWGIYTSKVQNRGSYKDSFTRYMTFTDIEVKTNFSIHTRRAARYSNSGVQIARSVVCWTGVNLQQQFQSLTSYTVGHCGRYTFTALDRLSLPGFALFQPTRARSSVTP